MSYSVPDLRARSFLCLGNLALMKPQAKTYACRFRRAIETCRSSQMPTISKSREPGSFSFALYGVKARYEFKATRKRVSPRRKKMKMKATAFSVVTLAVCFLAGAANAAPTFSGKFTFPYEVHWGRTVLPAGNYSITIDRFEPAAIVRSTNGKTHFVVMNPSRATASTAARFFSSLSMVANAECAT